jgi:hypothetical protein
MTKVILRHSGRYGECVDFCSDEDQTDIAPNDERIYEATCPTRIDYLTHNPSMKYIGSTDWGHILPKDNERVRRWLRSLRKKGWMEIELPLKTAAVGTVKTSLHHAEPETVPFSP